MKYSQAQYEEAVNFLLEYETDGSFLYDMKQKEIRDQVIHHRDLLSAHGICLSDLEVYVIWSERSAQENAQWLVETNDEQDLHRFDDFVENHFSLTVRNWKKKQEEEAEERKERIAQEALKSQNSEEFKKDQMFKAAMKEQYRKMGMNEKNLDFIVNMTYPFCEMCRGNY